MSSRRLPALVGVLVLVLGVVAVLLAGSADRRPVAPVRAHLPRTLPGDSPLTADVGRAPVGRALALHGRAVLVGTDGRTVRTLDDALRRNTPGADAPAPSLLSPDGTIVAVGSRGATSDLLLVDLATGAASTVAVPGAQAGVTPSAWSPDGARVALLVPAAAPDTTGATVGRIVVADVATRGAGDLPGSEGASAASFSPDGSQLAVQVGNSLRLVDPTTGAGVELGVPAGRTLAGGQAWSPDGAFLTLTDGSGGWEFLPVVADAVVPAPIEAVGEVLGWSSAGEALHLAPGVDGVVEIARTDLATGTSSTWTSAPASEGSVVLATGLVADAVAVPVGGVDQGPWPMPVRLTLVLSGAVLAVLATVGLRRRASAVRQVVAVPEWARDSTPG